MEIIMYLLNAKRFLHPNSQPIYPIGSCISFLSLFSSFPLPRSRISIPHFPNSPSLDTSHTLPRALLRWRFHPCISLGWS